MPQTTRLLWTATFTLYTYSYQYVRQPRLWKYCGKVFECESHSNAYEQIVISWFACHSVWEILFVIYDDADKKSNSTKNTYLRLRLIKITDWQSCGNFTRLLYWYVSFLSLHRKTKPSFENWCASEWLCAQSSDLQCVNEPGRDKGRGKVPPWVMSHNVQAYRRRGCKGPQLHSQTEGNGEAPHQGQPYFEAPMDRRLDRQKCSFGLCWT
jgi:hypothetical protein